MSQTLAIFIDQYRALRARKMFWIVLGISGLVVAAFGALGIDDKGLTLFGASIGLEVFSTRNTTPAYFYKSMFSSLGIEVWLSWVAALLALISTGGIFPEFLSSGVIDLILSKPIGRIRLFFTQYVAGLLFVTLQVGLFCLASFLVLGLRGGVWELWLFLAVPLVVCFFSFLFSVCVLLGVWTRSTVAAILLTILFWFLLFILNQADAGLLGGKAQLELQAGQADEQLRQVREQLSRGETAPEANTAPEPRPAARCGRAVVETPEALTAKEARLLKEREDYTAIAAALGTWSRGIYHVKTFLPKTSETTYLLERVMIVKAEMPDRPLGNPETTEGAAQKVVKEFQARSVAWVLGTSLAFEAVMLALACLIFCRRDY
jgi:ABC-type transport system involved in multi-copper enzyme maturation permease subunit